MQVSAISCTDLRGTKYKRLVEEEQYKNCTIIISFTYHWRLPNNSRWGSLAYSPDAEVKSRPLYDHCQSSEADGLNTIWDYTVTATDDDAEMSCENAFSVNGPPCAPS